MFFRGKKAGKFEVLQLSDPVSFNSGESLLEALNRVVPMGQSCGGMGSCGTCRVFLVEKSSHPEMNAVEFEMATMRSFKEGERLACQIQVEKGLVVDLTPQSLSLHKDD